MLSASKKFTKKELQKVPYGQGIELANNLRQKKPYCTKIEVQNLLVQVGAV